MWLYYYSVQIYLSIKPNGTQVEVDKINTDLNKTFDNVILLLSS